LTRDITRASGSNILLVISRPTKERRTSKGLGSAATFLELLCSEVPDVVLSITRALADKDLATTLRAVAEH
jgi:hypothetical protein